MAERTSNPTGAPFSRRNLLQAGAIGTLGLSLPQLLAAETVHRPAARPKSCIFIFQYGGLSQLDSWDPKPDAPDGIRGPYTPIATATPGFQVGELMPQLAKMSGSYSVIRSMSHPVPVHHIANAMLLGGNNLPAADAPAFGSIVTKLRPVTENIPAYVWLQKFGGGSAPPDNTYMTGGFLGMGHAPLVIGLGHEDNPATPGYRIQAFDTAEQVTRERLAARWQLLQNLGQQGTVPSVGPQPATSLEKFQERAYDLLHGVRAREAFDVSLEAEAMRDRYGRNPLGQNLLLSRRLIEAGVRLVSVVGWTGLSPGHPFMSIETWDMHGNAGIGIFESGWNGLGWALPRADQGVATLLADLEDRGLLESTLVVLIGEFGRTPKISRGAGAIGRDHWSLCYSAMIAGAGLRGGAVYGASDATAAYVKDNPVSLEDFTATLFHALDIDPGTRISPDGFSIPASHGQPVLDLFS